MNNLFGASKLNLRSCRTNEKSQAREGNKIDFHEHKFKMFKMIWKSLTTMDVENEKRSLASNIESRYIADSHL